MNARRLKSLLAILLLASLTACNQPTYSSATAKESVKKLCKDEYNLDVDVRIIGSTLGVFIPIGGLVSPDLKLNQKAGKKIEDVALSIHRVAMSTDRPLKFYTLTARDTKVVGAEFVLTGFLYDVVRVRLLDISRGEYYKRILRDFRFDPGMVGRSRIETLIKALNEDSPLIQNVKPLFYPLYTIGKKGTQKIELSEISFKETSAQEALFYVKTREYYEPMKGFEVYRAVFPSGFTNAYLVLVNISMFNNPIREIVPRYFYSGTEIRQRDLKATFAQYKDISYIGVDGLPKRDLKLDWFLSQQIARRIRILFKEDKRLKGRFNVESSEGTVDNSIFRFKFSITPTLPSGEDDEAVYVAILKLAGKVFRRYSFEDFEGLELIDIKHGGKGTYLSKEDLLRFGQNQITIKEIMQGSLKL